MRLLKQKPQMTSVEFDAALREAGFGVDHGGSLIYLPVISDNCSSALASGLLDLGTGARPGSRVAPSAARAVAVFFVQAVGGAQSRRLRRLAGSAENASPCVELAL
jgi:hypothetical protein